MIEWSAVAMPSCVLIAGCGYVGLRAARIWRSQGIPTFAITRSDFRADQLQADGIQPVILDLGSGNEWPPLPDADVVLWSVGYDRSPGTDRKAAWIDGMRRLLSALPPQTLPRPRRIIYTSSTGVYGDGNGQDVDELTPLNPNTEGGAACVAAEHILQDFARDTGTPVSILRLAGIYGPDRLLRRVSELRERVPLTTQPDEWLNLIHVDDAVRVIQFAGRTNVWPGWGQSAGGVANFMNNVMNVVAANGVTRRTYYSTLAKLVSAPEPVFNPPDPDRGGAASHRGRGGNRRVVSRVREMLPIEYLFDDCAVGLANAVAGSTGLQTAASR